MKTPVLATALLILASSSHALPKKNGPKEHGKTICKVPDIGTTQDSGPNIRAAFQKCQRNAKIQMDGNYLVKTLIVTPKLQNVEIELTGTITYSDNLTYWATPTTNPNGPGSYYLTYQNATTYFFLTGDNIWLHGKPNKVKKGLSAIDGQGQIWWDTFAVNKNKGTAGGSSTTFARPILLTIGNASNVLVEDITLRQGPFWQSFLYNSKNVEIRSINVSAVTHSQYPVANSDGMDVYRSSDVKISSWLVNNGDDCISLKPNCSRVEIGHMNCNGSHGISVGSLGQYRGETDIVEDVYVHDVQMSNAQNGCRIKVFPNSNAPSGTEGGGSGYVRNFTCENFANTNVDYPIILTTCYNYNSTYCAQNPTDFEIEDIHYINVTGTSSGKEGNVVVTLDCSAECEDITAKGTSLLPPASFGAPVYECKNVASEAQLDFKCTEIA